MVPSDSFSLCISGYENMVSMTPFIAHAVTWGHAIVAEMGKLSSEMKTYCELHAYITEFLLIRITDFSVLIFD